MKISRESLSRYFETLELKPDATFPQVKSAYLRLKKLYSSESPIIAPISSDFSKRKRTQILRRLDTAYTKLTALMELEKIRPPKESEEGSGVEVVQEPPPARKKFTGSTLRTIRLKLGIQLFDLALETKIRKELLKAIEGDKYEELPSEAYLRAHLKNYARFLALNPKKVIDDYLERYKDWQNKTTGS